MAERAGSIDRDLIVRLLEDETWALEEAEHAQAYARKAGAYIGAEPVPVSVKPNFISEEQERMLVRASRSLMAALNTFVDLFLEDPELQALWDVSQQELDLYRVDPGYPNPIQVSRFDGFLRGGELKLLEFNCDSPGGAFYGDVVREAFEALLDRTPAIADGYRLDGGRRVASLADALIACYSTWRQGNHQGRDANPRVVVTDWRDVPTRPDIEGTVERFRDHGLDAVFADPRDLQLDGDRLVHGGETVDLVYKRVIVKELLAEPDAGDLLEAYRAGTVCMVNSPRSVIVGNKKVLAALQMPEVRDHLTAEQRRAIDRHVPWTRILREGPTELHGFQVDLRDLVLENKDELVLKASKGYGGEDVHLGFETDPETWAKLVDDNIASGNWVVQQLVEIPRQLFPRIRDGQVHLELVNVNVNPFVFGGEYAGAYTRISQENIINVSHGGGIAATVRSAPMGPEGPA